MTQAEKKTAKDEREFKAFLRMLDEIELDAIHLDVQEILDNNKGSVDNA